MCKILFCFNKLINLMNFRKHYEVESIKHFMNNETKTPIL